MRPVELAGAVTDPDHVGRAVVPIAGERVDAGQAFLVGQDQRFVAREEVDLVQSLLGPEVDAAGGHEAQGTVDLRGDVLVALALAGRGDELLVPQVHLREVGEAALGEGPQQVECRGRLLVRGHQAPGSGVRASASKASSLTMWPRKDCSSTSPIRSVSAERGLANCPAMRPTFTTGTPAA